MTNPSMTVRSLVGATGGTRISAFEGGPFVLRHSAPHPGCLIWLDGPAQAGFNDFTAMTDSPSFFDLDKRQAGVPDGEEQLGFLVQASRLVAPGHQDQAPCIEEEQAVLRMLPPFLGRSHPAHGRYAAQEC
jgi:hypothetical protein